MVVEGIEKAGLSAGLGHGWNLNPHLVGYWAGEYLDVNSSLIILKRLLISFLALRRSKGAHSENTKQE